MKIIRTLYIAVLFTSTSLFAEEVTLNDDFSSGLDKWDKPSSSAVKIIDEELTNKTKYAVNVAFKEKNIEGFILEFKLKLLKKISNESGHFSIGIDRGDGKLALYLVPSADKLEINSMFYKNGEKKANDRKKFVISQPADTWQEIKIVCNKDEYKLTIGKESFALGKAPGKGGFSLGSYRQPFAIDNLKLVYEKPQDSPTDASVSN